MNEQINPDRLRDISSLSYRASKVLEELSRELVVLASELKDVADRMKEAEGESE
jgi:hypothetical protein